jgi:hypothetical protein
MNFKLFLILSIFIGLSQKLYAAMPPDETNFSSPVKHKITISGNFGELRGSHFHAGLDIKSSTGGEGDPIYAAEEGFISRIKIQRGGYGRAIYIDHPNGYSTVYAHLKDFDSQIAQYVENEQASQLSYEIDVRPSKGLLPLSKGSFLGLMGNSGHSFGAHLHFEIRETYSDNPMNPLLFKIRPFDDRAPILKSIRVTGIDESFQKFSTISKPTKKDKNGSYIPISIETTEQSIGFSLSGYDQNMSGNKNGIYRIELFVDDAPHYSINLNAFSFNETHLIEAHTDYELKHNKNITEILCYKLPGNRLSIINEAVNNGIIYLEEGQTKMIKLILTDFDMNSVTQYVSIFRKSGILNSNSDMITTGNKYQAGLNHVINVEGLNAYIDEKSLLKDMDIPINITNDFNGSKEYRIGNTDYPLLSPIKVEVSIPEQFQSIMDKTGFMLSRANPLYRGQEIKGNMLVADIADFGRYKFFLDTIAPKIQPLNFNEAKKANILKFKLTDNISTGGNAKPFTYQVFLDGNWKPCEMKETVNTLYVPIKDLNSGEHHLMIKVEDVFQNRNFWEGIFVKE